MAVFLLVLDATEDEFEPVRGHLGEPVPGTGGVGVVGGPNSLRSSISL